MDRIIEAFVNKDYSNLVFENRQLIVSKTGTEEQIAEMDKQLLEFERKLSANEIIHSIRYAFVK